MKPFVVDKNSWHYRLNLNTVSQNKLFRHEEHVIKYIESRDNLCSYWRMTLNNVISNILYTSILIFLALFIIYCIYNIWTSFLIDPVLVFSIITIITLVMSTVMFISHIIERDAEIKRQEIRNIISNVTTSDSGMKSMYQPLKNKTCMKVNFE